MPMLFSLSMDKEYTGDQIANSSRIKQGMIGEAGSERPALRSDLALFFFVVSRLWLETREKVLM